MVNFFPTLELCLVMLILFSLILQIDKYSIHKISVHMWYFYKDACIMNLFCNVKESLILMLLFYKPKYLINGIIQTHQH